MLPRISGVVVDTAQRPIWGASVIARNGQTTITATPTDSLGKFMLNYADLAIPSSIIVSAVGFASEVIEVHEKETESLLVVILRQSVIDVGRISVQSSNKKEISQKEITSEQIHARSSASLVPGNPTAALTAPQLAKVGSMHSSQIRISGTAPEFYLNGMSIGTDPNHFGAFSVVPGAVIQNMQFQPQGTTAAYANSSAVELNTPAPFSQKFSGALHLSTIEADGSFRIGNRRFFALGSLRKSTLDKLVRQFDISSNRRTVPPTNFQDVFASAGFRLSSTTQLLVDQYFVRDYLSYNTASVGAGVPSTQTAQGSHESFVALKLRRVTSHSHTQLSVALKESKRQYVAQPQEELAFSGGMIALSDHTQTVLGRATTEWERGKYRVNAGVEIETDTRKQTDLRQRNWNLLPPFAGTDNPFVYQLALNETFGAFSGNRPQDRVGVFASVGREDSRLSLESGLRYERISRITDGAAIMQRHHVTFNTGEGSAIRLHYGEYIENPVTAILEPNQALVRARLSDLSPIRTRLVTADYMLGSLQVGAFRKWIDGTPVVTPQFESIYSDDNLLNPEFIGMASSGKADFRGASAELRCDRFLAHLLSLTASYSWSVATRTEHGVTFPHELDSRHRFMTKLACTISRKISVGSEIHIRTGYPYSPLRRMKLSSESDTYSESYYREVLSRENSLRFPVNATLNLSARFELGKAEITCALTNVTNRYNPLISAASGVIYDAGILPSIGLTWKF